MEQTEEKEMKNGKWQMENDPTTRSNFLGELFGPWRLGGFRFRPSLMRATPCTLQ